MLRRMDLSRPGGNVQAKNLSGGRGKIVIKKSIAGAPNRKNKNGVCFFKFQQTPFHPNGENILMVPATVPAATESGTTEPAAMPASAIAAAVPAEHPPAAPPPRNPPPPTPPPSQPPP